MTAAHDHARSLGRLGLQYPWEAGPTHGNESAPVGTLAPAYEDHVSAVVARAVALHADVSGDQRFEREVAWPLVAGVAEWTLTRVERHRGTVDTERALGVAERSSPARNNAFVNMGLARALRDAIALGERLGHHVPAEWSDVAAHLVLPVDADGIIVDHDGFDPDEEKAATPSAPAGLSIFDPPVDRPVVEATLRYYLDRSDEYVGSPMLSSWLGVWAAHLGDRARSLHLFEEGYAAFCDERFHNVHEFRPDRFPDQPVAGPFYANLAGFVSGCLFGLTHLRPSADHPDTWCRRRPIVLPEGWDRIEVGRVWVRNRPYALSATHGDDRAQLVPTDG